MEWMVSASFCNSISSSSMPVADYYPRFGGYRRNLSCWVPMAGRRPGEAPEETG